MKQRPSVCILDTLRARLELLHIQQVLIGSNIAELDREGDGEDKQSVRLLV